MDVFGYKRYPQNKPALIWIGIGIAAVFIPSFWVGAAAGEGQYPTTQAGQALLALCRLINYPALQAYAYLEHTLHAYLPRWSFAVAYLICLVANLYVYALLLERVYTLIRVRLLGRNR